jgi:hypothetical protein
MSFCRAAAPAEVDIQVQLDVKIMIDDVPPRRLSDAPKMREGLRRAWRLITGMRWISNAVANEQARPLNKARNIASEALTEIADIWKVDHARSIETDDGFDWWPGDFRVSVSAIRRTDGYVPETWMLSVKTDFLKNVPVRSDQFVNSVASSSRMRRSTYAWVYPLAEVWDHYGTAGASPQLWFANTAYLTSENAYWLPRFLARMSIMQPIDVQLQAAGMPVTVGGGVSNVSNPALLGRSQQRNVLDETLAEYSSKGSRPNRWVGNGEFETIAGYWDSPGVCSTKATNQVLALEVYFDDESASIRLLANQKHPQLGNGLLGMLTLPTLGDMKSIADRCASLNLMETMWTDIPQFGCWYPFYLEDDRACLAFSTFIPNALYGPGIASQMVFWLYERARWVVTGNLPS